MLSAHDDDDKNFYSENGKGIIYVIQDLKNVMWIQVTLIVT